jgi:hypothetical protein
MSSIPNTRNFGLTLPTSNAGGAFGRRSTKAQEKLQEKPQEPARSRFNLTQLDASVATVKAVAAKPQEPARSRFNLSQLDISGAAISHAPLASQEPVRTRTFGALSNGADGSMNAFGTRARTSDRGGDRIEFSEQAAAAFGKKARKSDAPEQTEANLKVIARMQERNTIWSHLSAQMTVDANAKAATNATVKAPDAAAAAAPPPKKSNAKKSAKKRAAMDDDLLDYVPTQHTTHSQYAFEDDDDQDA